MMSNKIPLKEWTKEIRLLYNLDSLRAETLIEEYLEDRLGGFPPHERLRVLRSISDQFKSKDSQADKIKQTEEGANGIKDVREKGAGRADNAQKAGIVSRADADNASQLTAGAGIDKGKRVYSSHDIDYRTLSDLSSMLLGQRVTKADLSSGETLKRLAWALNTIFDKLNELLGVIHLSLIGSDSEFETIRHVIGSELEGSSKSNSLEDYVDQIKRAFLAVHKAFREAAKTKFNQILIEIDPDRIISGHGTGLGLNFIKKAKSFEIYNEKYKDIKKWFDSDRFSEEFLREFEKNFKKIYIQEEGEV